MNVLTFKEWCEANQDLVDEVSDELRPSGCTLGFLAAMGAEGAQFLRARLRALYDAQLKQDVEKLARWNDGLVGK